MTRVIGKEALTGFLFLWFALTSGCASIDYPDYRQTVLVISDPPGAKVYDQNGLIGTTPGYLRVRRQRQPRLWLEYANGEHRNIALKTKYRWTDSFAMNGLFYIFAPIGWGVDLLTGTAWDIKDPSLQRFGNSDRWPELRKPKIVAVAPPIGVDSDTVDALGLVIDEKLRSSEPFQVLDYANTSTQFQFYGSYQGLSEDRENRYRLYSALGADHILISKAQAHGDTFTVTGELKDVVTDHTTATYKWEITPGNQALREQYTTKTFINEYFHLIPNTMFLNLSSYTPSVTIDNRSQAGKEGAGDGLTDDLFRYVSAISIARLERSNYNVRGHWVLDFVPMIILSKKKIIFPNYAPVMDAEFKRWYVSGGYGLEAGYMGRYGFVYIDLIPALTWTEIDYDSPLQRGSVARTSVQLNTEIGYSYFFTDHLVGRLFARSLNEDTDSWNKSISGASGAPTTTSAVSSGFAGISIGYYIPSTTKRSSGWQVKKASH